MVTKLNTRCNLLDLNHHPVQRLKLVDEVKLLIVNRIKMLSLMLMPTIVGSRPRATTGMRTITLIVSPKVVTAPPPGRPEAPEVKVGVGAEVEATRARIGAGGNDLNL